MHTRAPTLAYRLVVGVQDNCILKMIVDMASTDTGVGARALAQVMEEETLQEQEGGAAAPSSQYLQHEGESAGASGRQRRSPRGKAGVSAPTSPSAGASRRRRISRTVRGDGQEK